MTHKWKIFYGDSTTFTDEDGRPEDAPCRNVQAIIQPAFRVGKAVCRQDDYYIYSESMGGWQGVDKFGLYDYLSEPGVKIVKFGRTINSEEYSKLMVLVKEDTYLPPKSAWEPNERKPR